MEVLIDLANRGKAFDVFSFAIQESLTLQLYLVRFLSGIGLRFVFMSAFAS